MIFILGGNGFVGSAFARLCRATGQEYVVLARDNYAAHRGRACSVLVNANGNSKKYLSNDEPLVDFDQSVRSDFIEFNACQFPKSSVPLLSQALSFCGGGGKRAIELRLLTVQIHDRILDTLECLPSRPHGPSCSLSITSW